MFLAFVPIVCFFLIASAAFLVRMTPIPQHYVSTVTGILFSIALVAALQTVRHKDPS